MHIRPGQQVEFQYSRGQEEIWILRKLGGRDGMIFTFENLFTNGVDNFWLHINFLGTRTGQVPGFL